MTELDFVLLTVYFLCVTYVLFQIVSSFNDELMVWLDQDYLNEQLEQQNLKDAVAVSFKFLNRYEFVEFKKLQIRINNKSSDRALYVDWDYCSLTNQYDPRQSRRVARLTPGSTLDAFQRQVFSVVAPGRTLMEDLIGEDMLSRADKDSPLQVGANKSLLDFSRPPKIAPEARKKLFKNFMNGSENFVFELELVLRFLGYDSDPTGNRFRLICRFNVRKLDWTAGLPWNPKLP
jgi:hypothetical protein